MSTSKLIMIQCDLRKVTSDATFITTAWLPQKYAVKDKYLDLLTETGWQNGWKVMRVHKGATQSVEELNVIGQQYRYTRAVSDI